MNSFEQLINELSELCGIIPEYWDIFGQRHETPFETKQALLRAIGHCLDSEDDVAKAIYHCRNRPWNLFIEPAIIALEDQQPLTIPVYVPIGNNSEKDLSITWSLKDESGQRNDYAMSGEHISVSGEQWIGGIRYIRLDITDNRKRPAGYYRLRVACMHPSAIFPEGLQIERISRLIIAPAKAYMPPLLKSRRVWGLSANLYCIRSERNWGVGDFTDLKNLIIWIYQLGGSFIGINPLHAITNKKPFGISPYSPVSRLYRNFIYLDVEKIPDVKASLAAQALITSEEFMKTLQEARQSDIIEYEKIAGLKLKVLAEAFAHFYETEYGHMTARAGSFQNYRDREGRHLNAYATFMALSSRAADGSPQSGYDAWFEWSEPPSDALIDFRKRHAKSILFYEYVQWLIDEQLKNASDEAKRVGMTIGIYHDLAFGSIGQGSDAWITQCRITKDISVGAPPDDFNVKGQNWGFPPLIPDRLFDDGYDFFIQTVRKNMHYCGALRIDHALGLFRMFWVPRGTEAKDGAYVTYPSDVLLSIIALESVRNKTIIVAEDLGTTGDDVRRKLSQFGMLSYRIFYFEKNYPDPAFKTPQDYPAVALCAVTTHDLPTLSGYWIGRDLDMKKQLALFQNETEYQRHADERERDRSLILNALRSEGIGTAALPVDPDAIPEMTESLSCAIYEYLAKTPCKLLSVSLDDIIGKLDQQNMPGVTSAYPSWIQKNSLSLENIMALPVFSALSEIFRRTGRGSS